MSRLQQDVLWRRAQQARAANRLDDARILCEQILRNERDHPNALAMLGQIAFAENRLEKAAAYMLQAASVRPRDPVAYLVLGEIRTYQGRFDEAVAEYDKALRWEPEHPIAIAGKADTYEKWGRRDEARALLRPLVEGGRETAQQAIIQARLDLHDRNHDAVIALARRHLERRDAEENILWHLCHHLGQALERTGRFDEAFAAYERGNRLIPARFDPDAWARSIDELIESFSPQRFADLPRASHGSQLPIFVVGMPRSGSTLVETILDAHPDAAAGGELPIMQELVNSITLAIGSDLPYPACIEDLEPADVDAIAGSYLERLRQAGGPAPRIVDKYLNSYRHVGMLAILFPQARIIHCRRDPLDTCFSCFQTPLPPATHPYASSLGDLGFVYVAYERLMAHWRDALEIPMLELPYETMVEDQEATTRALLDFCGLDFDQRCLRFYESKRVALTSSYDQVNRPVYASSVGRWRNFEKHLGPLQAALGRPATAG